MIKLLKDVPQEVYKKKLGYNFTAFYVSTKEVEGLNPILHNVKRGDSVTYCGRKCVVCLTPIHKGSKGYEVGLMLVTNNPNDYIKENGRE